MTRGSVPPPRLATWVLERFGVSRLNESIVGDLVESYQLHRSGWRYSRQVAMAVVSSNVEQVRSHKVLAVRALVTGWLLFALLGPFAMAMDWLRHLPPLEVAMSSPMTLLIELTLFFLGIGWLVARLHRQIGIASTMLVATSFAVVQLYSLSRNAGDYERAILNGASVYFVMWLAFINSFPIFVVAGGLLDTSRDAITSSVSSSCASVVSFVSKWRDYAGHD